MDSQKLTQLSEQTKMSNEIWIPTFEYEQFYEVSNFGRVLSICPKGG